MLPVPAVLVILLFQYIIAVSIQYHAVGTQAGRRLLVQQYIYPSCLPYYSWMHAAATVIRHENAAVNLEVISTGYERR